MNFARNVEGSWEDVAKEQVSRLTNQKREKENEKKQLENGLVKKQTKLTAVLQVHFQQLFFL